MTSLGRKPSKEREMTEPLVELRDATEPCGSHGVDDQTAAQVMNPNIRGEQVPRPKGGFAKANSDHALRDGCSARPTSMKQKPRLSERMDTGAWSLTGARRGVNLALATWVSVINFWAWNMIGPLSTTYAGQMSLNSIETSLLVATPILVGSLGRIVAGPLADRFGGRIMLIAVSLASVVSVLAVGAAGAVRSYPLLLAFGFLLGVAGTVFAAGIPFVNNWFEPARRGLATGVFGAGMIGTGFSAYFTPRLLRWFGLFTAHLVVAVALAVTAALCIVVMRNGPGFTPNTAPALPKLKA